ncbi:bifunctional glutamate N-acetyltransferase/amino-acid acetyltransferase ArgJ [Neisseriaceae bacterium ESL0693]|nr:bifunctional glutamate N-acetyltransferase/amino-acid acetyltransferase ArgJ [Neisseriaceae bacterium ESL0693]
MSVTFARGFRASGVAAGISSVAGRKDLALVVNQGPLAVAAGVFTTNRFAAAPVLWSRARVATGQISAVLLNAGCANACTGAIGAQHSRLSAEHTASLLNTKPENIALCSTGMIGETLPIDRLCQGIDAAVDALKSNETAGLNAAQAILTTDTVIKTVNYQQNGYRLGGMAKGAGMIAPQLATMLCVFTTDAIISAALLQQLLAESVAVTFNRIDVDGCMSTNDTILILASGASGIEPDPNEFKSVLTDACASLCRQMIADAEGAHHSIAIHVTGAEHEAAALACARAVASSNLFKCAVAGNDPNWGRIISSLGTVPQTVARYDPKAVTVDINGIRVCSGGAPDQPRDSVDMSAKEVKIDINLNTGNAKATVWSTDLTVDYVHINADYES